MSDLEPCPFCGGEAILRGHQAPEFWIACNGMGCKASTEGFGGMGRAIAAWNTRATCNDSLQVPDPRAEVIAVLEEAIKYSLGQCSNEECDQCRKGRQALAAYRKAVS